MAGVVGITEVVVGAGVALVAGAAEVVSRALVGGVDAVSVPHAAAASVTAAKVMRTSAYRRVIAMVA
ncbi:hypothetical protein ACFQZZ_01560 [Nocardia sp. GCM10030253]|uniref:hypothetical protein n=1 Tax=Nocardia sp. GCM10030253 TaxID=3273404 RepID=UPI00363A1502